VGRQESSSSSEALWTRDDDDEEEEEEEEEDDKAPSQRSASRTSDTRDRPELESERLGTPPREEEVAEE
jgi:hypothetical protein